MSQTFLDCMGIPPACALDKPVYKKMFLENLELDATDKKILKEDIESIRWSHTLKTGTINIPPFIDDTLEYQEIAILKIEVSNPQRLRRMAAFINKAIPYPLILLFRHHNAFAVALADKRLNQADRARWVVVEEWATEWIPESAPSQIQEGFMADCALKNLSSLNFYAFYQDLVARVVALNAAAHTGRYEAATREKTAARRDALREIAALERQIAELRTTLQQETQFNRKVDVNMAIQQRNDAIKRCVQDL